MANLQKRLPNNIEGNFFVDSTCIDCDTCRQLAPQNFAEDGDYSYIFHQPQNDEEQRHCLHALLACPTSSIGTVQRLNAREALKDFPMQIEGEVYYLGFHSEKSFGASSYLICHSEGNWMIDSPRLNPFLMKQIEKLGGIQYIFLTHRDDVADAKAYAKHFNSERIIHQNDADRYPDIEQRLNGTQEINFKKDFLIIPTPGHTKGHCVLLFRNRFLFSGDHLWWSRHNSKLGASKRVCWYDWDQQTQSMEKLLNYSFEWLLPGHGRRVKYSKQKMHQELTALVSLMKKM